jgi:hypothetical protein
LTEVSYVFIVYPEGGNVLDFEAILQISLEKSNGEFLLEVLEVTRFASG